MKNRVKFIALSVIFATQSFAETKTDGFELGIGIHVGSQKTSRKNDSCFAQDQKSVKSVVFGGSVSIGYVKKIGNSFGLGFDIGADFGKSAKQLKTSGYLASNSEINQNITATIGVIINNFAISFHRLGYTSDMDLETNVETINLGAQIATSENLDGFIKTIRYMGGSNDVSKNDIENFVKSEPTIDLETNNQLSDGVVLENFSGKDAISKLQILSGGDKLSGLEIVRNYIIRYCPYGSFVFQHMLETNREDFKIIDARLLAFWLSDCDSSRENLEELGINADNIPSGWPENVTAFKNVLNPDLNQEFANNAIKEIKYNLKSSFDISPNIGIKFGVYVNDGRSFFYIKPGITQLNGRIVAAENNEFGIKNKKFNKITPMFSIGYDQRIGNSGWGVGFEVSHAFKTSKKLDPINVLGTTFTPKKSIHRTCVRLLLTKIF